jgi:hypothetical protein
MRYSESSNEEEEEKGTEEEVQQQTEALFPLDATACQLLYYFFLTKQTMQHSGLISSGNN